MSYAELCVTSNFTFLKGASHPEELMLRAVEVGLEAIAITDRNSLAGVVRAYSALKTLRKEVREVLRVRSSQQVDSCSRQEIGTPRDLPVAKTGEDAFVLPKLIVGTRLVLRDSPVEWIALPTDRAAYERLSQLLTLGKRRAQKAECHLDLADLVRGCRGMILIAVPPEDLSHARVAIQTLARHYPGAVFTGAAPRYDGSDQAWFNACAALALRASAPMVAIGDVLMHSGSRKQLADVLTCLREGITIDRIGTRALANSERRLKGAPDMARLFRHHPAALRRTVEIANRCSFDLSELKYEYPHEGSEGEPAQARLERLAREGVARRYPQGADARVQGLLEKELILVRDLRYAAYFLTVYDIVAEAKSRGILCQGRGSAANSIICYLLGITDVSPDMIGMVVERFISRHRDEPPDIDVDFEHERREEIIQWIYEKYGRDRAGLCATVIHFRTRAAIREVGKVMGLSQDVTASLSGQIWGMSNLGADPDRIRELGLNPEDRRLAQTIKLISEVIGFPRHLSQHVGGFIITQGRLDALCPIENAAMEARTVIEWDKDDIDALGILKVDILSLGMLTCLRKSFDLLDKHERRRLTLDTVPQEDKPTYDMLTRADAVGVFQVESRAQMNFLPRMRPKTFYDLVIEVAIVRPGPIQGGMVKPYIRRRQGIEAPEPFGPALMEVTRKTLGVPLFQEQAMQIAVVGAGYSPEEADQLRRSIASFRRMGTIGAHRDRFVNGMKNNGYSIEIAEQCFSQIEGFADYGFPESHAAAFAMLTYVSSWLKCHYPAIFACALLNSQPMGFYAPAQIVRDAREHGVELRPICVNHSGWDNTLERRADGTLALRLGFRQIKGFREEDAGWIVGARGNGYPDPESLWLRAGVAPATLERLAEADAFTGMNLTRRDALWAVRAIRAPKPLPLFADPLDGEGLCEPEVTLPNMHLGEEVVEDYVALRLSLRAHPMELLRPMLSGLTPHDQLVTAPLRRTTVCGLVITRQRPGTASGVVFLTLEDETGVSNIVVWPKVYEQFRRIVMGGRLLRVTGRLQREGTVVHLIAEQVEDLSYRIADLGHPMEEVIGITQPAADDAPRPPRPPRYPPRAHHPREQAKRLFPSRDFH
ncbi:error-prone DNA polymerase [Albirhodobacter sp. R86504]|uniref:error-prone DNA polymerase n=1 Tax=Albirhodobacter sp. R86504 TaxID=3093848 RepID=UPI00366FAA0E